MQQTSTTCLQQFASEGLPVRVHAEEEGELVMVTHVMT